MARLDKNKTMANLYRDFMEEYGYLGHMTEVQIGNTKNVLFC